ncbi:hypothetical protein [[Flexibacter] sp. ATCC 35208]|uniref:hypothetical protein n=1 Tax=[Flexibacter] sp. ATCC 35208 TaxID=1936242 RepID=UPI001C6FCA43|nr:hypothetical protein [[Flexibacter] sp. ATCC 35208]
MGGIQKLPKNFVSSEFNNDISKLERPFLQDSLISAPREIVGPGKRGNLSSKKETKGKICIMKNNDDHYLGYLKKGRPYSIPTLKINTENGQSKFSFDATETNRDTIHTSFASYLQQYDTLIFRSLKDSTLSPKEKFIGIDVDKDNRVICYLASTNGDLILNNADSLNLAEFVRNIARQQAGSETHIPIVRGHVDWRNDYFRIFGKMAFNFLALVKGYNFAIHANFDAIRNWIVNGGENKYVKFDNESGDYFSTVNIELPPYAHTILLAGDNEFLVATIRLYEGASVEILLGESTNSGIITDGLICDWQQRKEYRLNDYLKNISQGSTPYNPLPD